MTANASWYQEAPDEDTAPKPETVAVNLRLSAWLWARLMERSGTDDSLQALIRRVLREWLAAHP